MTMTDCTVGAGPETIAGVRNYLPQLPSVYSGRSRSFWDIMSGGTTSSHHLTKIILNFFSDDTCDAIMRQTTKLLMEHLLEPLALITELYIIDVTRYISDIATAGHWELLNQFMGSDQDRLDGALYGAARGDSIALVQHILDRGATDYSHGLLGACCGTNLDAAKLILLYDRHHGSSGYGIAEHMNSLGQYSGSIKMFNWFCDEFNPEPALISETIRGAIKSANMAMISAALSRGGKLDSHMMFEAGESGERGMVLLLQQYGGLYQRAFVGACYAGQINLIKWLMKQKQSADYDYDQGFVNASGNLDVLKYLAANAEISSMRFTFVLQLHIHGVNPSEYGKEISAATGIHSDENDYSDIVRWITSEHSDKIIGHTACVDCGVALRYHAGVQFQPK